MRVAARETGKGVPISLAVFKKEDFDVTTTMKHTLLPEGMALVETAKGRWFAAYTSLSERQPRVHLMEEPPLIPLALDSCSEGGTGYDYREDALAACYAWYEVPALTKSWQELSAHTELYPEHNAWYLDEIAHLVGDNTPRFHYGLCVQAVVYARGKNGLERLAATGHTPNEAIEALYQRVYEWSRMLQEGVSSRS